jgi:hypothetical protein
VVDQAVEVQADMHQAQAAKADGGHKLQADMEVKVLITRGWLVRQMLHFKEHLQETTTTILVWKEMDMVVEQLGKVIQADLALTAADLAGQLAVLLFTVVVVVAELVAQVSQHQAVTKWAAAAQA